jgi:hypothetical protein
MRSSDDKLPRSGFRSLCIHSWLAHHFPWAALSSVASFLPFMHTRGYGPGNLEPRQDQKPLFLRASVITCVGVPALTSIPPLLRVPSNTMPPSGTQSPN